MKFKELRNCTTAINFILLRPELSVQGDQSLEENFYHILFLTRWYPHPGDPQLGVFIRKHALAASKFSRVSVLNVRPEINLKEKYQVIKNKEGNFSETIINYKTSGNRLINFLRYIKAHFKGFNEIKKSKGKPDLIHTNVMFGLCIITLLLSFTRHTPYIISEHWHGFVDNKFRNKGFLFKRLLLYTARNARALIAVSEFLKAGMISNGIKNKITVIPNVVESRPIGISNAGGDSIKMLTVADLVDDIKNVSAVILALNKVIKPGDSSVEYHIIGGGRDEAKLRKLATDLKLADKKIFFHGLRANSYVLEFLNQVDFVIINSRYETFSIIAAESLLSGKPLICTQCGGVSEFIDEDCGVLIDADNDDQLKQAIEFMIANYKKFDPVVLSGKVSSRFNGDIIGKQIFEVYKDVLKR